MESADGDYAARLKREEERAAMMRSDPGRACLLVEAVLSVARRANEAFPSPREHGGIEAVARDDMVWFAERMLGLQREYASERDGVPTRVDAGYHYTREENLPRIRAHGLLTRADRDRRDVTPSKQNGSTFGDGIYTSNNPEAFSSYGDFGLIVGRLQGRVHRATKSLPRGARVRADTVVGDKLLHGVALDGDGWPVDDRYNEVVLRSSGQCLPMIRYGKTLLDARGGKECVANVQKSLESILDEFFNGARDTSDPSSHDGLASSLGQSFLPSGGVAASTISHGPSFGSLPPRGTVAASIPPKSHGPFSGASSASSAPFPPMSTAAPRSPFSKTTASSGAAFAPSSKASSSPFGLSGAAKDPYSSFGGFGVSGSSGPGGMISTGSSGLSFGGAKPAEEKSASGVSRKGPKAASTSCSAFPPMSEVAPRPFGSFDPFAPKPFGSLGKNDRNETAKITSDASSGAAFPPMSEVAPKNPFSTKPSFSSAGFSTVAPKPFGKPDANGQSAEKASAPFGSAAFSFGGFSGPGGRTSVGSSGFSFGGAKPAEEKSASGVSPKELEATSSSCSAFPPMSKAAPKPFGSFGKKDQKETTSRRRGVRNMRMKRLRTKTTSDSSSGCAAFPPMSKIAPKNPFSTKPSSSSASFSTVAPKPFGKPDANGQSAKKASASFGSVVHQVKSDKFDKRATPNISSERTSSSPVSSNNAKPPLLSIPIAKATGTKKENAEDGGTAQSNSTISPKSAKEAKHSAATHTCSSKRGEISCTKLDAEVIVILFSLLMGFAVFASALGMHLVVGAMIVGWVVQLSMRAASGPHAERSSPTSKCAVGESVPTQSTTSINITREKCKAEFQLTSDSTLNPVDTPPEKDDKLPEKNDAPAQKMPAAAPKIDLSFQGEGGKNTEGKKFGSLSSASPSISAAAPKPQGCSLNKEDHKVTRTNSRANQPLTAVSKKPSGASYPPMAISMMKEGIKSPGMKPASSTSDVLHAVPTNSKTTKYFPDKETAPKHANLSAPKFATMVAPQTLAYIAPSFLIGGIPPTAISLTDQSCNLGEDCVVCHEKLSSGPILRLARCQHVFHTECIERAFKTNPQCPICRKPVGAPQGKSPSGKMTVSIIPVPCAGFQEKSIEIRYEMQSGIQLNYHENPNQKHSGKVVRAYLPNNINGQNLLKRLAYAFKHGLTFSIGTSMTTGKQNQCTWASVHHKTSMNGGIKKHGFPDSAYFSNCNGELDGLGVPPASVLYFDGTEMA